MREIRTSSSMRGRRKRAASQRACALLYRSPAEPRRSPWLYLGCKVVPDCLKDSQGKCAAAPIRSFGA
jgi:hypothetical protein